MTLGENPGILKRKLSSVGRLFRPRAHGSTGPSRGRQDILSTAAATATVGRASLPREDGQGERAAKLKRTLIIIPAHNEEENIGGVLEELTGLSLGHDVLVVDDASTDGTPGILQQAGQPLHYDEITKRAINHGLIETKGKTPNRTMNAQISTSISSGDSPFVRVGRGIYGLADWSPETPEVPTPTPRPEPKEYCSFKDAAQRVLTEIGRPLHYKDITQRALDAELINPQGLTPEATMGAQLYSDIKRNGAASVFRKEARGVFGLAAWEKGVSGITRLAAKQSAAVKKQLLEHLHSMEPGDFERLVARLLGAMGYDNITVTRRNADRGVDVLGDIQMGILRLRTAVQVKRLKTNVQRPVVSQLRGDMMALPDVDQGMIISTSGFSAGAAAVARVRNAPPIVLIDGDRLADLLIEHGIGVRVEQVEVVTFDEERLWVEDED